MQGTFFYFSFVHSRFSAAALSVSSLLLTSFFVLFSIFWYFVLFVYIIIAFCFMTKSRTIWEFFEMATPRRYRLTSNKFYNQSPFPFVFQRWSLKFFYLELIIIISQTVLIYIYFDRVLNLVNGTSTLHRVLSNSFSFRNHA